MALVPGARLGAYEILSLLGASGKSIAYVSNQSGRYEVYVQSLVDQGRWRLQVSTDGGFYPRWRADGREIFYASGARKLMMVPWTTGRRSCSWPSYAAVRPAHQQPGIAAVHRQVRGPEKIGIRD
jgi:WD40 repeat protein